MTRTELTQRQQDVYTFIRDKILNRGYGPTVREIGEQFSIKSPNGVMCHLRALEKKGLITRCPNKSRAIELTEGLGGTGGLPYVGVIAAGATTLSFEQSDRIDFSEMFARDDMFVLRVAGDSMIEAQIADGDYVVLKQQKTAHVGQIVVARTPDDETTLKYWHPENGRIRLQPANSSMQPIYVPHAEVLGVLVGLVRNRF
ncbi:MAG TPA: transcriptional repressor LexA [Planctomycetaceae bacterium]|nr:transcriptional repressor LexA [Planctomycetaceae bacterium]